MIKKTKNYKSTEKYYSLATENGNDRKCVLKFSHHDDNKYPLWELQKDDLKKFITYAKKVEKLSWQDIFVDKGLNYEKLPELVAPDYLEKNTMLYSMRASKKFRIIGYRSECYYFIVWFDNNHETC